MALRSEVVALLAEGHTVEVVAPDAVATAHRYLTWGGIAGCVQLATMVSGFESVVVQLQPGLPVREGAGRLERELSLAALSLALRRGRHVVLRIERLDHLPGGPTGRAAMLLWHSAERIVLGDEVQRAAFVASVGTPTECTVTRSPEEHAMHGVDADEGGWGEGSDISAENVLELVRARAARERRELAASGTGPTGSTASTGPTGSNASTGRNRRTGCTGRNRGTGRIPGWERLPASGIVSTVLNPDASEPSHPRKPSDLARSVLAVADRRPLFRPAVRAIRFAYRSSKAALRSGPDRSG